MDTVTQSVRADGMVERILSTLQDRIGPQRYKAWFKHGTRIEVCDTHVKVSVPNPFVANWIETHYRPQIAEVAGRHAGRELPVVVTIDPDLSGEMRRRQLDSQADIVDKATTGRARPRTQPSPARLRHTLDDFIVGECNKLAYSAALAVTGSKTPPFNPLFIHGSCGVGKTHLLQGVCNAVGRRADGTESWKYVTAEQFTNDFIGAMRARKLGEFRQRYRALTLLAIDDVHFLSGKKATQEEFLHTFNAIESAGNQIVLASDAHPRMVGELAEQLVSRFVSGMVVKVDAPDPATRLEVLRRRAAKMRLSAGLEVLEYIAAHVRGSVRELEGALCKLAALSALEKGPVTLPMATDALADHLARTDSAVTCGDIESAVAAYFGITAADIHSSRRTKTVSTARMVAMYLARRQTRMSYPEIGRAMGKNHSSVVLACQKLDKLLAAGGELQWSTPMGPKSLPAAKVVELLTEQVA